MSSSYWEECIGTAAEECDLKMTPEQLVYLTEAVESYHDNYSTAFYSPPASDRLEYIEREYKAKLKSAKDDHERYVQNANDAVKQALGMRCDTPVTIGCHGEVLRHGGRTERVQ